MKALEWVTRTSTATSTSRARNAARAQRREHVGERHRLSSSDLGKRLLDRGVELRSFGMVELVLLVRSCSRSVGDTGMTTAYATRRPPTRERMEHATGAPP